MARVKRMFSVLLLEDSEHLGHVGDVVEVKPGYARNYLLPGGYACPVTKDALRRVERAKQKAGEARVRHTAELAELAKGLDGLSLTIEEKASEEGHLFGSVGAAVIAAALSERGVHVQDKQIELEAPLKELGIFNVLVRLDKEQTAEIRVWIVETTE